MALQHMFLQAENLAEFEDINHPGKEVVPRNEKIVPRDNENVN